MLKRWEMILIKKFKIHFLFILLPLNLGRTYHISLQVPFSELPLELSSGVAITLPVLVCSMPAEQRTGAGEQAQRVRY